MKTLSNKIGFLGALFNILTTLIILSLALFCSNLFVCLIIIIIQSIIGFLIGKHLSNLKKCNTTDYLTGLANKGYFSNRLLKEISQAKKYNISFAVLFLDIDDFKKINDVYGHNVGDNVLKKFSSEMEKTVRDCDLLARWGGDEFAIILHNSTMKETKKVIERLQFRLQKPLDNLHINVSIGYTLFDPQNPLTSNELIQNADKSLYEIKRFRKNNNLTKKVNRKLELVENI